MFWVNVDVSQVKLDKQLLASQHIMAWRRLASVPRACVKAVRAKYNANWPVSWSFGVEFLERMFVCKLTFAHWNLCVFLANKADVSDALIWSQGSSLQSQRARSWSTWNLQRAALATRHGYTTEESHPKGSRTLECSKNQSFVFNALASLLLGMPPTLLRLSPPTQGFHVNTDCSMVVSAWKLSVSVFLFSNRCLHDFSKSTKQNNYMHSSDRSQQADAFKFLLLLSELLVIISYYNWSQSQKLLILILDWFSSSFSLDYPWLETQHVVQNLV